MDAQRLMEEFGMVAEAPEGVAALRQAILELAVRGRLVEQDPADEPADALLERLLDAKQLWKKESRIPVDEGPFAIPANWKWTRLEQIVDFSIGRTPPTKVSKYWADEPEGVPWVSIGDLPELGVVDGTSKRVSQDAVQEVFKSPPSPAGTLLMSFKLSIGKIAFLNEPAYHNEAIISIFPPEEDLSLYLHCCMRGLDLVAGAAAAIKGATLNKAKLRALLVPLPPLAEQRRIVARVDELMALCDQLEEKQTRRRQVSLDLPASLYQPVNEASSDSERRSAWVRVRKNFDDLTASPDQIPALRQAILELAVRGRLVEQDAAEEPADALLAVARSKRAALPKARLAKVRVDHERFALPDGWLWAIVDDCFDVVGGIQKSPKRRPFSNAYPYLRVANVQRNALDLSEVHQFELFNGELDRLRLLPGDILVVEGNGSASEIGRCAIWEGQIENCVHQNHLIRCRPLVPNIERFCLRFLNSPTGIRIMKQLAVTTSGLYNLSVGKIRAIPIPLPPVAEQGRIVARVDELMALCDELEDRLARRKRVQERLAETLTTVA